MIFLLTLSLILTISLACLGTYLMYQDREKWRELYFKESEEARKREHFLFDQNLRSKGVQPVAAKDIPYTAPKPTLSSDEIARAQDELQEMIEHGMITPSESVLKMQEIKEGRMSIMDLSNQVWAEQTANLRGSTQDIY